MFRTDQSFRFLMSSIEMHRADSCHRRAACENFRKARISESFWHMSSLSLLSSSRYKPRLWTNRNERVFFSYHKFSDPIISAAMW